MPLKKIQAHFIWEPSEAAEHAVENAARAHLLRAFAPGTYEDAATINRVLQHQFTFYEQALEETLPGLASRHLMEFVLSDYDGAARIQSLYRRNELSPEDRAYWGSSGRPRRRALKYLAERIAAFAPPEAPVLAERFLEYETDRVLVCAEELVRLSALSENTYRIAPESTVLTLREASSFDYIELRTKEEYAVKLEQRMFQDAKARSGVIGPHPLTDVDMHNRHLAVHLRGAIGLDYKDALNTLHELLAGMRSVPDGFDVPFTHEQNAIDALSAALTRDSGAVRRVLEGFLVSPGSMRAEGRKIWRPKQEYRAFRRGVFEMPHATGVHLTWSREMAKEALVMLVNGTPSKRLPKEWLSPDVERALEDVVAEASRWFERRVAETLAAAGVQGRAFKSAIGEGPDRLAIPQDVGEIDFLGHDPSRRLIVLGECKLVRPSTEPALFRDDLSKFTEGPSCYAKQIERKRRWVRENSVAVRRALSSLPSMSGAVSANALGTACITFIPTIADYFMPDCRCVALTEILSDLGGTSAWPYAIGIDPLGPA